MKKFLAILFTILLAFGAIVGTTYAIYIRKNPAGEPTLEEPAAIVNYVSTYSNEETAETIDFTTWQKTAAQIGDKFVNRYFMVVNGSSFSFGASTSGAWIIYMSDADGNPVLYRDAPYAEEFRIFEPVGVLNGNNVYYIEPNTDVIQIDDITQSNVSLATDAVMIENYGDVSTSMFFLDEPVAVEPEDPADSDNPTDEPPAEKQDNFWTGFKAFATDNVGLTILVVSSLVVLIIVAVVVSKKKG